VKNATASSADEVIVVVGAWMTNEVVERLREVGACVVVNEMSESEMIDSLRIALKALQEQRKGNIDAFIVMLADQPAIGHEVIDELITAWHQSPAGIIIPTYKGKRGHPVLLSGRYIPELLLYRGEYGLRSFIVEHSNGVKEVPVQTDAILRDIDTNEDYERELRMLTKHSM
jgi:molybdenum cofactor cytidylyltransferase